MYLFARLKCFAHNSNFECSQRKSCYLLQSKKVCQKMEANGYAHNVPLQIKELYIFNSKFGNDTDNEMGKVLYAYPSDTSQDNQLKQIGLCEAIVKFTETFNSEVPCESLHTLKARHIYYQPEPGYWFILILSIPTISKKSNEGVELTEYLDDEVQDNVFKAVLEKIYEKFVLLNDKFEVIFQESGLQEVTTRLKKYYDTWVQRIDANHCGVTDIFRGLQFLPLSRDFFLKVQCFLNNFIINWPQIKYIVLMQREKLIWSGVEQSHIQLLYDYLVNDLLSQHFLSGADKQSTFGVILKRESHISLGHNSSIESEIVSADQNQSKSSNCEDEEEEKSTHKINGYANSLKRFHLLIYKAEQSYLTMLIPVSIPFDKQLVTKIEGFLNLNFTSIAKDLVKFSRGNANSSPSGFSGILSSNASDSLASVKYLYFNSLNFAEKMSPGYQCDLEAYKLLADLKLDLSKMNENGEIITKMVSDNWMVAKVSNKREFYAIFNHKNSNLLEIDEEMRKLTETHLTNIFFQE